LHNTYGVEIAVGIFGDVLENADGKQISVRDVAIAHLKEDLSGKVPTLNDWFGKSDELLEFDLELPKFDDEKLQEFVARPFLRSGIKATLFVTLSDFGVELCEKTLGAEHEYNQGGFVEVSISTSMAVHSMCPRVGVACGT
jgi:hypothetical protein